MNESWIDLAATLLGVLILVWALHKVWAVFSPYHRGTIQGRRAARTVRLWRFLWKAATSPMWLVVRFVPAWLWAPVLLIVVALGYLAARDGSIASIDLRQFSGVMN